MQISNGVNIIGIIPARMASSRFPGKPLAKILGLPMIGHIYLRSKLAKLPKEIYIATCDREIMDYAVSIGAKAIMTKSTHRGCVDRCVEAVLKIEKKTKKRVDIMMLIQGDEPMVRPEMVDETIKSLIKDKSVAISNLGLPIKSREEHNDPNVVKVVVDKNNFVLYFSREPIPSWKKGAIKVPMQKQTGLIAFKREGLIKYGKLKPTTLEVIESVDMLRMLENGIKIKMVFLDYPLFSVDTPEGLAFVEEKMKGDELMKLYL